MEEKERPLTPEEAIAAAKRDLAPFWYNSEPLLAAVRTEAGASVLPLNSNFVQKAWTYVFVDPTEFAGERALQTAREWHRRYSSHGMGFLIVFRAPLPFAKGAADYLKQFQIQSPGMFDLDALFSTAFGISSWPAVVVQYGATEVARGSGANWTNGVEEKIQVFQRQSDPGLASFLPFETSHPIVGSSRSDFGSLKGKPIASMKDVITLAGDWKEAEDCIWTNDPKATATIKCGSQIFALIAQATKPGVPKIHMEPLDGTMLQEWACEGTTIDENGVAVLRIQGFGLYYALKGLPTNRRSFRLSFPDADGIPIQIFGLRFGSQS